MVRIILFCFFSFLVIVQLAAQKGLYLGLASTSYQSNINFPKKNFYLHTKYPMDHRVGIGFTLGSISNKGFGFELGLHHFSYSRSLNSGFTTPNLELLSRFTSFDINHSYLNIPITLNYFIGQKNLRPFIKLGIVFIADIKHNMTFQYWEKNNFGTANVVFHTVNLNKDNFDLGFGFKTGSGLSYTYHKALFQLGIFYSSSEQVFTTKGNKKDLATPDNSTLYDKGLEVQFGLNLFIKTKK